MIASIRRVMLSARRGGMILAVAHIAAADRTQRVGLFIAIDRAVPVAALKAGMVALALVAPGLAAHRAFGVAAGFGAGVIPAAGFAVMNGIAHAFGVIFFTELADFARMPAAAVVLRAAVGADFAGAAVLGPEPHLAALPDRRTFIAGQDGKHLRAVELHKRHAVERNLRPAGRSGFEAQIGDAALQRQGRLKSAQHIPQIHKLLRIILRAGGKGVDHIRAAARADQRQIFLIALSEADQQVSVRRLCGRSRLFGKGKAGDRDHQRKYDPNEFLHL